MKYKMVLSSQCETEMKRMEKDMALSAVSIIMQRDCDKKSACKI